MHALSDGQPGTYVEIGGGDGLRISNTFALEHCLGWRGLLIEANPALCKNLERNVAIHRPNSSSECSAVCDENDGMFSFAPGIGDKVGGNPDFMSKWYKDRFKINISKAVSVPCTRMSNLMTKNGRNMHSADFLSLDVGCAEEFVLNATNIRSFKLVLVEVFCDKDRRSRIRSMMHRAGFTMPSSGPLSNIRLSDVFIRNDLVVSKFGSSSLDFRRVELSSRESSNEIVDVSHDDRSDSTQNTTCDFHGINNSVCIVFRGEAF